MANNLVEPARAISAADVIELSDDHDPSTRPGSEGHICKLPEMLDEYYAAYSWQNEAAPEAKLKELEILLHRS